jgi:hypothetical protein
MRVKVESAIIAKRSFQWQQKLLSKWLTSPVAITLKRIDQHPESSRIPFYPSHEIRIKPTSIFLDGQPSFSPFRTCPEVAFFAA